MCQLWIGGFRVPPKFQNQPCYEAPPDLLVKKDKVQWLTLSKLGCLPISQVAQSYTNRWLKNGLGFWHVFSMNVFLIWYSVDSPTFNTRSSLLLKILIRQDDAMIFRSCYLLASPVNSAMVNRWIKRARRIYKNLIISRTKATFFVRYEAFLKIL